MKKISTFRGKGSKKFLLNTLLVIIIATIILVLFEQERISDYIFIGAFSYYFLILGYYKYIDE